MDTCASESRKREKAISKIISGILDGTGKLDILKRKISREYGISSMIKNSELLAALPEDAPDDVRLRLRKKPSRTMSGITSIAVMIKPEDSCRKGCIYCPFTGKAAKSYTGEEPAALRARQAGFDPKEQVKNRISQLTEMGHPTEKCEIIIMGGTFLETDEAYQRTFVKGIYDTLNGEYSGSLEDALLKNEKADHRAVGLTIETRPDVCKKEQIGRMLSFGATRVELGVQHPDDSVYLRINRGHTVEDVARATRNLRNAGLKVCYHIMPGLPGSDREKDISMIKKIFEDERFCPDMLKIYPTLVIPETELERMVDKGEFSPYSSEEAAEVIAEFFRYIPEYVRVMRVQRDIPAGFIGTGVKKSNLRQLVDAELTKKGIVPKEIRSREIGLRGIEYSESFSIRKRTYQAGGGTEFFISSENENGLIAGFIRMRFPKESNRQEIEKETALIRELHVYGREAGISRPGEVQHKGIGKKLLEEAEKIAREEGKKKITIISGVGVREYYFANGYARDGPYVSKML
jgi:elongator complex protein 3